MGGWFYPTHDLGNYEYLVIRHRGDGNTYYVNLRCPRSVLSSGHDEVYQARLETRDTGTWTVTWLRLCDFQYVRSEGYDVGAGLRHHLVLQFGIVLGYPCVTRDTDFCLDIESIRAANAPGETRLRFDHLFFESDRVSGTGPSLATPVAWNLVYGARKVDWDRVLRQVSARQSGRASNHPDSGTQGSQQYFETGAYVKLGRLDRTYHQAQRGRRTANAVAPEDGFSKRNRRLKRVQEPVWGRKVARFRKRDPMHLPMRLY